MKRNNNPSKFFSSQEQEIFQQAVEYAEKRTSAEIKVVIVRHCWIDIKRKACKVFKKFRLYETKDQNAVLIMIVTTNHEFVIYGDHGIHEKVGDNFWNDVSQEMLKEFKENRFGEGLKRGIAMVGEKLSLYFPKTQDDQNEISDNIEFENS